MGRDGIRRLVRTERKSGASKDARSVPRRTPSPYELDHSPYVTNEVTTLTVRQPIRSIAMMCFSLSIALSSRIFQNAPWFTNPSHLSFFSFIHTFDSAYSCGSSCPGKGPYSLQLLSLF